LRKKSTQSIILNANLINKSGYKRSASYTYLQTNTKKEFAEDIIK